MIKGAARGAEHREAITAWNDFLAMGEKRSFMGLAASYEARFAAGEEVPTRSADTLGRWAKKWDWAKRLRTADQAAVRELFEARGTDLLTEKAKLYNRCQEALDRAKPGDVPRLVRVMCALLSIQLADEPGPAVALSQRFGGADLVLEQLTDEQFHALAAAGIALNPEAKALPVGSASPGANGRTDEASGASS